MGSVMFPTMCFVISYPRVRTGLAARQRLAAAMSVHHHLDDDRNHTTRHRIAHQLHSNLTMPVPFEALLPYGIMLGVRAPARPAIATPRH